MVEEDRGECSDFVEAVEDGKTDIGDIGDVGGVRCSLDNHGVVARAPPEARGSSSSREPAAVVSARLAESTSKAEASASADLKDSSTELAAASAGNMGIAATACSERSDASGGGEGARGMGDRHLREGRPRW